MFNPATSPKPLRVDSKREFIVKLLFLCTHNRCRSILCEAIANQRGKGLLQAASAGSTPVGSVHHLTLCYLRARGYKSRGLFSKPWSEHEAFNPDRVITVCDSAVGEECPFWIGDAERIHWSLPDPSIIDGNEDVIRSAFMSVIDRIEAKIDDWVNEVRL